ncbi:MAG: hypothetical protein H6Q19_1650 [Bacteroidetes bacterium]|nr:hypothetical protein [Bacteroidota bacterium]
MKKHKTVKAATSLQSICCLIFGIMLLSALTGCSEKEPVVVIPPVVVESNPDFVQYDTPSPEFPTREIPQSIRSTSGHSALRAIFRE